MKSSNKIILRDIGFIIYILRFRVTGWKSSLLIKDDYSWRYRMKALTVGVKSKECNPTNKLNGMTCTFFLSRQTTIKLYYQKERIQCLGLKYIHLLPCSTTYLHTWTSESAIWYPWIWSLSNPFISGPNQFWIGFEFGLLDV